MRIPPFFPSFFFFPSLLSVILQIRMKPLMKQHFSLRVDGRPRRPSPCAIVLCSFLAISCVTDWRSRRLHAFIFPGGGHLSRVSFFICPGGGLTFHLSQWGPCDLHFHLPWWGPPSLSFRPRRGLSVAFFSPLFVSPKGNAFMFSMLGLMLTSPPFPFWARWPVCDISDLT